MGIFFKKIKIYLCERCGYEWQAAKPTMPIICPRCKSKYWNHPKKRKWEGGNPT